MVPLMWSLFAFFAAEEGVCHVSPFLLTYTNIGYNESKTNLTTTIQTVNRCSILVTMKVYGQTRDTASGSVT